jgi:RNA polymerase sigma-70 factor, ECF subfamily
MLTTAKLVYLTLNPDLEVAAQEFRHGAGEYLRAAFSNSGKPTDADSRARQSVAESIHEVSHSALAIMDDEELMHCLQSGCNDALAVLFDRYHRLVFSIALRIVRDRGEAEDVMQGVFLDIYRSIEQFDAAKGTTKVWILQYAYHRAINRRQYLNARKFYQHEAIDDNGPAPLTNSWFMRYTRSELGMLLKQGLATLNSREKRVIELASYEGLSMKEVAEKTGETLVNVRHHYYRGLRKLRAFVERAPEPQEFPSETAFEKTQRGDVATRTNSIAA